MWCNIYRMVKYSRYMVFHITRFLIQWSQVFIYSETSYRDVSLPIAFSTICRFAICNDSHSALHTGPIKTVFDSLWNVDGTTKSTCRFITNTTIPVYGNANGEGFYGMMIGY